MASHTFAWLILAASIFSEVAGNIALRYADGFTKPLPSVGVAICYGGAIWLMAIVVKYLELGLTYAVWAGAGTAITALVGIIWFNETSTAMRLLGLGFIVVGVFILNFSTK